MRIILFIVLLSSCSIYGQQNDKISTIDFVQILDNNKEEALYYYQNNWKVLRNMALKKGYIHSYQILEVPPSEVEPFHLMVITTYLNNQQYELREEHFTALIKEKGALSLMNDRAPNEFRKTIFSKKTIRHWN